MECVHSCMRAHFEMECDISLSWSGPGGHLEYRCCLVPICHKSFRQVFVCAMMSTASNIIALEVRWARICHMNQQSRTQTGHLHIPLTYVLPYHTPTRPVCSRTIFYVASWTLDGDDTCRWWY